jgi:hypothetical protein
LGKWKLILVLAVVAVAVAAVWFFVWRGRGVSPADSATVMGKKVETVPYPFSMQPKEREAWYAEVRKPEKTRELVGIALDAGVEEQWRRLALVNLAAAKVGADVLYPLAVKFSGEKSADCRREGVLALGSLLMRRERLPDEGEATEILLKAAGKESDAATRTAAAQGLAQLKSQAAVKKLAEFLSDEERLNRQMAFDALRALSGDGFGYDVQVKPGDQAEAIAKWGEWARGYSPAVGR